MKRYIDADALTFSRVRIIHPDGTAGGWNAVVMSSVINNAPTADVVEVVRCRDCKYYRAYEPPLDDFDGWCPIHENDYDRAFYCQYGERREEKE